MSKLLFELKGEFYKGERIYCVHHGPFYTALRKSKGILKDLIKRTMLAYMLVQEVGMVHADIKPDNILLEIENDRAKTMKLIDFGSVFSYVNQTSISMSTPEYLAPEVLEYL